MIYISFRGRKKVSVIDPVICKGKNCEKVRRVCEVMSWYIEEWRRIRMVDGEREREREWGALDVSI